MKKLRKRVFALFLAALAAVLPVYAAESQSAQQADPWMDFALFHMGNVLPFMRQDELSFLEPGCQVYLGARLSVYLSDLSELSYAMYPVFVDGQAIAIATVMQSEDGELSFMAGPQFAEKLNEFIADNPNIALIVGEDFTQVINDKGETETLLAFYNADIPAAPPLSSIQFSQAAPAIAIQEVDLSQDKTDKESVDATDVSLLLRGLLGLAGLLLRI